MRFGKDVLFQLGLVKNCIGGGRRGYSASKKGKIQFKMINKRRPGRPF
jgi:hypothetical protein